ncbi:MAG: hypothetical protein KTR31_38660 [Myxococcales bacterium]|nr:hypothetical protein [Myxococcales bacterium]
MIFVVAAVMADALACTTPVAGVWSTTPRDGATNVPTDSVIRMQLHGTDIEDVRVIADGDSVNGTVEWPAPELITFVPDVPLPVGALVEVGFRATTYDVTETFSFEVGSGPAGGETSMVFVDTLLTQQWSEAWSTCDADDGWAVQVTARLDRTDEAHLGWLVLRQQTGSGAPRTAFVARPGLDGEVTFRTDQLGTWTSPGFVFEDQCFVLVHLDGYGGRTQTDLMCATTPVDEALEDEDGVEPAVGCSQVGSTPGGAFVGMLLLGVGARKSRLTGRDVRGPRGGSRGTSGERRD